MSEPEPLSASTSPIALLHLSDFHFKKSDHPVLERAAAITDAVRSMMQPLSAVFVVVTGDIAFSGLAEEYDLADAFFRDVLECLTQALPGIAIQLLFTPGNHDCDLIAPPDLRDYSLLRPKLRALDASGAIVVSCASVQSKYFEFTARFGQTHANGREMLVKRLEFLAGGIHRVAFTSYNSAWLSQNPEKPGQLYIPETAFNSPENAADVEIAMVHHPWNWLDPDNLSTFRAHLESTEDLILSGHQHRADNHHLEGPSGSSLYLIEGRAMYDPRAVENGFQVVLVAPTQERWQLHAFIWDGARYSPTVTPVEWNPFLRNKALEDGGFSCTPSFKAHLIDPGVAFTHGGKQQVFLHDIFVYPDLHQRDIQRKVEATKPSSTVVRSKEVLQWVHANKRVLLIGEDKAGRTALAKTLYRELQREHKLVPLLLSADDLD